MSLFNVIKEIGRGRDSLKEYIFCASYERQILLDLAGVAKYNKDRLVKEA